MKCGKEPGGAHAAKDGVCPAATADWLDGVHDGKNGGRACWVVAGTLSEKSFNCVFSRKYETCGECSFLRSVVSEEYPELRIKTLSLAETDGAS